MANLFEKMGLVRTEYGELPEMPAPDISELPQVDDPETPEIDASQVSSEDVISSIYEQASVVDDNSIYKIKAYIDVLPAEMTTAKKQASIAGIMSVNKINVGDLIKDGENRVRVLDAATDSIKASNEELIANAEADIENLKSLIESAEASIEESKKKTADSIATIQTEREAVSELLEFASGVTEKEKEGEQ